MHTACPLAFCRAAPRSRLFVLVHGVGLSAMRVRLRTLAFLYTACCCRKPAQRHSAGRLHYLSRCIAFLLHLNPLFQYEMLSNSAPNFGSGERCALLQWCGLSPFQLPSVAGSVRLHFSYRVYGLYSSIFFERVPASRLRAGSYWSSLFRVVRSFLH